MKRRLQKKKIEIRNSLSKKSWCEKLAKQTVASTYGENFKCHSITMNVVNADMNLNNLEL